jgi:hypothetical protein
VNNKKTEEDEVLSCEDWTVALKTGKNLDHVKSRSVYRVKVYQTKTDHFYSEIHPTSIVKLIKYLCYFW